MIGTNARSYGIGETMRGEFPTLSAAGVHTAATVGPTGVLVVNGTATGVTVTFGVIATGLYSVSCSLAGRSVGDDCYIRVTATVDGKNQTGEMPGFRIEWGAALSSGHYQTGINPLATAANLTTLQGDLTALIASAATATGVTAVGAAVTTLAGTVATAAALTAVNTNVSNVGTAVATMAGTVALNSNVNAVGNAVTTVGNSVAAMASSVALNSNVTAVGNAVTTVGAAVVNNGTAIGTVLTAVGNTLTGAAFSSVFTVPRLAAMDGAQQSGAAVTLPDPAPDGYGGGSGGAGFDGAAAVVVEFTDSLGDPVKHVTFSVAGIGSITTASDGSIEIGLANGTYAIAALPKNGVIWPVTMLVVTGDRSITIEGGSIAITPSVDPLKSVGYTTTRDHSGDVISGADYRFRLIRSPSGSTDGYSFEEWIVTSPGLLEVEFLRGGRYTGSREDGTGVDFTVPQSDTFALPPMHDTRGD